MMSYVNGSRVHKGLTVLVALCLFVMTGLVYPATIPQQAHHGSDHASAHTTPVCAWLCMVGPGGPVEAVAMPSAPSAQPLWIAPRLAPVSSPAEQSFLSRAPPTPVYA